MSGVIKFRLCWVLTRKILESLHLQICRCCSMYKRHPLFFLFMFFLSIQVGHAQVVRIGVKAGPRMSWMKMDDTFFKDTVRIQPTLNYTVGAVASFKVKDRYFLHTELNYTTKGKITKGKIDPLLEDRVTYRYLDVPALFSMQFKGKLKSERQFKWYLGVGPNVSYWLGGNGVIKSSDLYENNIDKLKYSIKFGTRPNADNPDEMYVEGARRLQFGIVAAGGVMFEPAGGNKFMIDLRYEGGHSQLGTKGDFLIPTDYDDNLRARNRGLTLSVIYLLEYNLNPDVRNRGKSTIKRR